MNRAVLLTGGNIGDRETYLKEASERLHISCGKLISYSLIYETEAWGKTDQDPFLNQALLLETVLSPEQLLTTVLDTERQLGRVREEKYGPRTIDIDIIFYDDAIINQPALTIPHPQIQNRRFALQCLADIVPDYIHPVLEKTVEKLLLDCQDPLQARVFRRE